MVEFIISGVPLEYFGADTLVRCQEPQLSVLST